MNYTHFGHACVLVESSGTRVLIDPGTLSAGYEELTALTAILITHNHPDHLDTPKVVALAAANPDAALYCDEATLADLADAGAVAAVPGAILELGTLRVEVLGGRHAEIYEDFPGAGNVGYLFDGGAFYHPGDSFDVPPVSIDVFALPINGPWTKIADAIDHLHEVRPRVAVPIHADDLVDKGFAHFLIGNFAPEGTTVTVLEAGVSTSL